MRPSTLSFGSRGKASSSAWMPVHQTPWRLRCAWIALSLWMNPCSSLPRCLPPFPTRPPAKRSANGWRTLATRTLGATRCRWPLVVGCRPVNRWKFFYTSRKQMDPSETLQRLYAAGFELQTFERFPKAIGVSRGEVMVLLENTPAGLKVIGSPGWRMGDFMGVLTTKDGKQVFQWKEQVVE